MAWLSDLNAYGMVDQPKVSISQALLMRPALLSVRQKDRRWCDIAVGFAAS